MPKPHVLAREFTRGELSEFLTLLVPGAELVGYEYLFGGLSTTTVWIKYENDSSQKSVVAVLKIFFPNCPDLTSAETSMRICSFIHEGNSGVKISYPLHSGKVQLVELVSDPLPKTQFPCILMKHIGNAIAGNAEQVGVSEMKIILSDLGQLLAEIHCIVPSPELPSFQQGGAVELARHSRGEFLTPIAQIGDPEFTKLYMNELPLFRDLDQFPVGIIHGDPFLDNVLVDKQTHKLAGLVDFEDACVGPVMFDIGSAIAGSCFTGSRLDFEKVQALVGGYVKHRKLSILEQQAIPKFVRIALVCNAAFRFLTYAGTANSDAFRDLADKLRCFSCEERSQQKLQDMQFPY